MNNENVERKQKGIKSPFIKYCITTVSCLLMCGAGFLFLVFGTNSLYTLNEVDVTSKQSVLQQTQVSTVVNNLETDDNVPVNPSNPQIPGVIPNLSDNQVYNALNNSSYQGKAYALSCVFKVINDTYGYNAAVGIMANVWHEGNLGLVQYDKTVPNWDGNGNSATSTQSNPLIVSSNANVDAVRALGNNKKNDVGVGIVQWTWYTYLPPLADAYNKYCSSFSQEELALAETERLMEHANQYAAGLTGTVDDVCKYWLLNYENPKDATAKITERCNTAKAIDDILKGVK